MEKTRKTLTTRLDKLMAEEKKDDVVTFEQLGVDRLFVDESHAFKNLFLYTKMRNVAGLSTSEAQRSSDMFMKCRYMDGNHWRAGDRLCYRYAGEQFHVRALYGDAISSVRYAPENGADTF